MLDRSANGLFDILERRIPKVQDDFRGELKKYLNLKKNQKSTSDNTSWTMIYDQESSSNYINYKNSIIQSNQLKTTNTTPMKLQNSNNPLSWPKFSTASNTSALGPQPTQNLDDHILSQNIV